ncbi:TerD family protein [Gordonia spumicola]|nr:TerD family protein [Gordonia spumicola]
MTTLTTVTVRTFWDSRGSNNDFDLDLAAFVLTSGRVANDSDFVFFNNPVSTNGAVKHSGGADGVTEETLTINLDHLPPETTAIAVLATVYNGNGAFGDLCDAVLAIDDEALGPIAFYEIAERHGAARALVYALIVRDGDRWILDAMSSVEPDLQSVARRFGVNV